VAVEPVLGHLHRPVEHLLIAPAAFSIHACAALSRKNWGV
jgi:hypothetical protein